MRTGRELILDNDSDAQISENETSVYETDSEEDTEINMQKTDDT
jgi:hypothetical protein